MWLLILSCAWATVVASLLNRAMRQYGFYEVIGPHARPINPAPSVAVIIPAGNEAENIQRCLDGLRNQFSLALPLWAILGIRGGGALAIAACALSVAASLAIPGTHVGAAHHFKIPVVYGFLYPLGYTVGAGILLHAAVARRRGRVVWKDRAYVPVQPENSGN